MNVLGWDPSVTVIQTDKGTSLTLIAGQNYYLFNSSGSGPSLKEGGADVVVGQFGAWTPIGAVQTANGYDVAWKDTNTNQYTVWTTDSSGNFLSYIGAVSGTDYALESLEPIFNQDLNGDKTIGLTKTLLQTDGTTSLTAVANRFFLYDSTSGSGPSLKEGGADVVAGEFGAWTPIGAVQITSGYDVAWKETNTNQYTVWTTDSSGNFLSYIGAVSGTSYALESLEPTFGQDLNGDKVIGVVGASSSASVASTSSTLTLGHADVPSLTASDAMLGYSVGAADPGGTSRLSDSAQATRLTVLSQYMAATSEASASQGSTLVSDPPPSPQSLLAQSH
jgi:20S proteasome alpha/beta subunit